MASSVPQTYESLMAAFTILQQEKAAAEKAKAAAEERARIAEEHPEGAKMRKDIARLRGIEQENGGEIYHSNQKDTAVKVCECIRDAAIVFQMVLAPCQSGKTGCMLAIIEELLESNSKINPEKIFVITGLSDKEWVAQTRLRLPLGANVIHRGQLNRSKNLFENLKNAVLLVDECQIASKQRMSIDKVLHSMGLKDLKYLKENNVNLIEFSATPNNSLDDVELWTTSSAKHMMEPGKGYKGHKALINNNRLYQAQDLYIDDDVHAGFSQEEKNARNALIKPAKDEIKRVKRKIDEYNEPRFHIIRIPSGDKGVTVIGRIKLEFGDSYIFMECFTHNDTLGDDQRLVKELMNVPQKPTVLFIKQSARCAATFPNKSHIGVLYERLSSNVHDDTIVQGLAGRACGYDVDDGMVVFSNVESIEKYVAMVESGFTDRYHFTFHGHKSNKATHLRPSGYTSVGAVDGNVSTSTAMARGVVDVKFFDTHEKASVFIKGYRNSKRGPNKPKVWAGGFLTTSRRDGVRVYSSSEIVADKRWGMNVDTPLRYFPCYDDKSNPKSLKYACVHMVKDGVTTTM
jgi:hypothetical protein